MDWGDPLFYIDLKCTYLEGGKIKTYRVVDDIDLNQFIYDPYTAFNIIEANSALLVPAIGVGVIF